MPTPLDPQIRALVERFTADLEEIFRDAALEHATEALSHALGISRAPSVRTEPVRAQPAATRARSKSRKPGAPPSGRIRRSEKEIEAVCARILAHVRANPGQRAEEIKRALGLKSAAWMLPIQKLVESGRLKGEGDKRGRTYTAA